MQPPLLLHALQRGFEDRPHDGVHRRRRQRGAVVHADLLREQPLDAQLQAGAAGAPGALAGGGRAGFRAVEVALDGCGGRLRGEERGVG